MEHNIYSFTLESIFQYKHNWNRPLQLHKFAVARERDKYTRLDFWFLEHFLW